METGKVFEIPKELVWKSYKAVRRKGGSAGYDRQTIATFEKDRDNKLYKIWNRLSSGSYMAPPVLAKAIPKGKGKVRVLGIPTVSDRIAQGAVKLYVESHLDPLFDEDSYGYRGNKSAHDALSRCRERCWSHHWVLEIDIRAFFDTVRHDLVLDALKHHKMPRWVELYCERWLRAPLADPESDSKLEERQIGTPQGGVISPLLANLFLHYAFDKWIRKHHPRLPFERYADDIVCHCQTKEEAIRLKEAVTNRFQEVGLEVNEEKSKVVYVGPGKRTDVDACFTFLGYDFRLRTLKAKKTGHLFRGCAPGASKKAMKRMTEEIRSWTIHRRTEMDIQAIARKYNAILRGWIMYYGKFWKYEFNYRLDTVLQLRLIKWMKAKYRIATKRADHRLKQLRRQQPTLFAHWYLLRATTNT